MPPVRPRIVVRGELCALLNAGMAVEPEDYERVGMRVFEPCSAEIVEGGNGGFLRIGNDAVNGLLTVHVGLMFEVAADGVRYGVAEERRQRKDKKQRDESCS